MTPAGKRYLFISSIGIFPLLVLSGCEDRVPSTALGDARADAPAADVIEWEPPPGCTDPRAVPVRELSLAAEFDTVVVCGTTQMKCYEAACCLTGGLQLTDSTGTIWLESPAISPAFCDRDTCQSLPDCWPIEGGAALMVEGIYGIRMDEPVIYIQSDQPLDTATD